MEVGVELLLLAVLQERTASTMDNAFGSTRRAGREENIERMFEGHRRERQLRGIVWSEKILPGHIAVDMGFVYRIGDRDHGLHRGEVLMQSFNHLIGAKDAAIVAVMGAGE